METKNKKNNKQILFIFLAFSVMISFSHILIEKNYHSISSEEILLKNAKDLSVKKEKILNNFLKDSKTIISATRNSKIFNDYLNSEMNEYEKNELKDLFLTLMSSNNNFMQFKFIDEHGQEIVKVARKSRINAPQIIQDSLLKNKSTKYYFSESKYTNKNDNRIYNIRIISDWNNWYNKH